MGIPGPNFVSANKAQKVFGSSPHTFGPGKVEASRQVPVEKEQSNSEVQARSRFWPEFTLYFTNITSVMSDASSNEFSALCGTPCCSLTSA
eukprot:1148800-Pelagomonas_calceolata.AAC.5